MQLFDGSLFQLLRQRCDRLKLSACFFERTGASASDSHHRHEWERHSQGHCEQSIGLRPCHYESAQGVWRL
jgi:hypothetical protein